jgi:hypothetical protein
MPTKPTHMRMFPVGPLVPLPGLTREEVRVLEEVEALRGDVFKRRNLTRILRALLRHRCIQVMAVSPAKYRVTKLGDVARRFGKRKHW